MTFGVFNNLFRVNIFAKTGANNIRAAFLKGLLRLAEEASGELRTAVTETLTKKPTGRLARSFKPRIVQGGEDIITAEAMSELVYSRIQNQGGVIRPKGRMLAIPLRGVPRGKWPRDWGSGQLFRAGKVLGVAVLRGAGKGREGPAQATGRIKAKYVLAQTVTIKGVHYVEKANERFEKRVPELVTPALRKALDMAATSNAGAGYKSA